MSLMKYLKKNLRSVESAAVPPLKKISKATGYCMSYRLTCILSYRCSVFLSPVNMSLSVLLRAFLMRHRCAQQLERSLPCMTI